LGFPQANRSQQQNEIGALKKRSDFLRLRTGKKFHSKSFTLQAKQSDGENRVGLTVTTKVGNAVVRNRIKRRLREVSDQVLKDSDYANCDYVLIAREHALSEDFQSLKNELSAGLDHVHRNRANDKKPSVVKA